MNSMKAWMNRSRVKDDLPKLSNSKTSCYSVNLCKSVTNAHLCKLTFSRFISFEGSSFLCYQICNNVHIYNIINSTIEKDSSTHIK